MVLHAKRAHVLDDPYLAPYAEYIHQRAQAAEQAAQRFASHPGSLAEFACAHEYYGLHKQIDQWVFREWAPNATAIWLVGDFSGWKKEEAFQLQRLPGRDVWEIGRAHV